MILRDVIYRASGTDFTLGPLALAPPVGRPWLVLGPSGSGKSTLLRLLAGQLAAHTGDIQRSAPVAYLPQRPEAVLAGRNLAEDLSGSLRPPSAQRARLREALVRAGLVGVPLSRRGNRLSAGERRALALAVLSLSPARGWALDEPDAALDAAGRRRLLHFLTASAPSELYIASHRPEEYRALDPWTVVLKGGKIVAQGEWNQVMLNFHVVEVLQLRRNTAWQVWQKSHEISSRGESPTAETASLRDLLECEFGLY